MLKVGEIMLPVKVNANCTIINGPLEGYTGKVVAFNYLLNEVEIDLGDNLKYITVHENIEQK